MTPPRYAALSKLYRAADIPNLGTHHSFQASDLTSRPVPLRDHRDLGVLAPGRLEG